ncbi:23S rRNA (guanosine(2251)-2'-O)-methyltransferase RlmB [Peptococcus simiae]|uniref:23S rRNA (guanosine(2251)-2'-O)-methyltransferase RlmB n=1 Tax=Peptococcus simiae TaxID=1643805 RepID=UPI00397F8766
MEEAVTIADLYGRNAVREALKSEADLQHISLAKGARHGVIEDIRRLAKTAGVPVREVDRRVLDRRFPGKNHQGVAATLADLPYVEWEEIVRRAKAQGEVPLILLLDDIEDPQNLGAMMRSADAFGAHGIIIPKRRAAGLTEGTMKAACGAGEYVPVARVANLVNTLKALKKEGFWVCGSAADGTDMYETDLTGPLVLVIGNEGKGMGRLVSETCDFIASIPIGGQVGSLNASVACGILLAEISRQRRLKQ